MDLAPAPHGFLGTPAAPALAAVKQGVIIAETGWSGGAMEPENFEKSLRLFARRRPFQSFVVRFEDGNALTVDCPEALIVRGGIAVYVSSAGDPTLFDHHIVSALSGAIETSAA